MFNSINTLASEAVLALHRHTSLGLSAHWVRSGNSCQSRRSPCLQLWSRQLRATLSVLLRLTVTRHEHNSSLLQSQGSGGWGRRIDNSRQPALHTEFQAMNNTTQPLSKNKILRTTLSFKLIGWSAASQDHTHSNTVSFPLSFNYRWEAKPGISPKLLG